MFFPLVLEGPVGPSMPSQGGGIFDIKTVLNTLGFFDPPTGEITQFTEQGLFDGISDFQSSNNIPVSAALRPGDRTMRTLRDRFARAHGRRQNGVVRIADSVGAGGINAATDLGRVGSLLRRSGHFAPTHQAPTASELAPPIRAFQARVGLREDGLIKPNGETLEILGDVTELNRPTLAQAPIPQPVPTPSPFPQSLSFGTFPIRPGMVITDVPGAYREFGFDPDMRGDIWNATARAYGLTMIFVKSKADSLTRKLFGTVGNDDAADAFRHAYGSYLLTKLVGANAAKRITDGHEAKPFRSYLDENAHGSTGQILMDLLNNRIGRAIFRSQGGNSQKPEKLIMDALRAGKLQVRPFKIRKIK